MKKFLPLVFLFIISNLIAQQRPKLVVGIVVDQMKMEYLYRFQSDFSENGFKRLIDEGYTFYNMHYNFMPTYTAPGHASIYTGTTPAMHGIVSNEWFSRSAGKEVYCTDDASVKTLGDGSKEEGEMSPKNLQTTTITDELRLSTNFKGKVIGISMKDRGAILPAGHFANWAFWYSKTGSFISSTFYGSTLPDWVTEFNSQKGYMKYINQGWDLLKPIATYDESLADDNPYEGKLYKVDKPVFPYDLKAMLDKNNPSILRATPFGNDYVADFAKLAIEKESLGKDTITDFLAVSFSSTDYVGHSYGSKSIEIEDVYLRLDLDLQELFKTLDAEVGTGNYTLFLTADHGAAEVPAYLQQQKIPSGLVDEKQVEKELKGMLFKEYGDSLILDISNQQVFIDHTIVQKNKLVLNEVENKIAYLLLNMDGIAETYTAEDIKTHSYTGNSFKALLQNGYNHKRSGDVLFRFNVAYFEAHMKKGTTHGAEFSYDTHVPLLFYGWGIKAGSTVEAVNITDIAPTVCSLLNIPFTNGCSGKPIKEVLEN